DLATSFQLLEQNLAHQYELSYASPLDPQPGQKVDVAVSIPRVGDGLRATFSYVVPAVRRQASGPVDPGQLQPVVEPTPVLDRLPQVVLPNSSMAQVAAILTAAAVFAVLVGISLRTTRDRTEIRLAEFVAGVGRLTRRGSSNEPGGRLMVGLLNSLAGVATWLLPANQIEQVRRNLILA